MRRRIQLLAFIAAAALTCAATHRCLAGTVVTVDGKRYEGDVKLETRNAIQVTPKVGSIARIDLANVLRATFGKGPRPAIVTPPPEKRRSDAPALPPPITSGPEGMPTIRRGVVLVDGTVLSADDFTSANDVRVIKFVHRGSDLSIPLERIARLVFKPSAIDLTRIPAGRTGAVLATGDFFEGSLIGIEGHGKAVRIDSILFGISYLDTEQAVTAVILRPAERPKADMLVRTADGSLIGCKNATIDKGALTIVVESMPQLSATLTAAEVVEIRAGGSLIEPLATMPVAETSIADAAGARPNAAPTSNPTARAGDAYTIDALVSPLGAAPDAQPADIAKAVVGGDEAVEADHLIAARSGVNLSWKLDGQFRSLLARAAVPAKLLPVQRLSFVILADGREIFRSQPRTSIDDVLPIALPLVNVQTLTLRVDGASHLDPAAIGAWIDPMLVRAKAKE